MVATDQPRCFPSDVLVALSSKADGSMLNRVLGVHHAAIISNRERFCEQTGVLYENVVYQKISYGADESYALLQEVSSDETTRHLPGVHADALFTREPGVGLFLPVADCVATVVYDPVRRALALLHLGRHSTLTDLVEKTVTHFKGCGSDPGDLIVWMSPSAKGDTYRLEWFDYEHDERWKEFYIKNDDGYFLDLPGYNRRRFTDCGVAAENVFISPVDTTKDPHYFSHLGDGTTDRIALLAMML